jgi:hypothetical protein
VGIVVKSWSEGSCAVITVEGVADARLGRLLADGIAGLGNEVHAVVVDLDELLLTDLGAVRALLGGLLDLPSADRLVVSCRRLSGRRILRRIGGEALRLTEDRLTALALAASGGRPQPA